VKHSLQRKTRLHKSGNEKAANTIGGAKERGGEKACKELGCERWPASVKKGDGCTATGWGKRKLALGEMKEKKNGDSR